MKYLYTQLLFCIMAFTLNGQNINEIPNQYPQGGSYIDLDLADFVEVTSCYSLLVAPSNYVNGLDGYPNLSHIEFEDYRENMTVTLKIQYAGFHFQPHAMDEIWVFDEENQLVENTFPQSDPFNPEEQLLFLNVKGNFEFYAAKLVYYSGSVNKYFTVNNAIEYASNKIIGDPLNPFLIELAPIEFQVDNDVLSVEEYQNSYQGDQCLVVNLYDCDENLLDSEEVCYHLGDPDCMLSRIVDQSEISGVLNGLFEAKSVITSEATIEGQRDIIFSAADSIILLPGFEVGIGASFEILMEGCN